MNASRLTVLISVLLASLVLIGCPHQAGIRNVDSSPLTNPKNTSMTEIAGAIRRAGAGLGWQMKEVSTGHILGTLNLRKHVAVVDITFDNKSFNIQYKHSTNLNYKSSDKTIHSNYNGWIQNLENSIMAQTSGL